MQAESNSLPSLLLAAAPYQAYQFLQWGKAAFSTANKTLTGRIVETFRLVPKPDLAKVSQAGADLMRQRLDRLLERDWQDAEAGIYPKQHLFEDSWQDFFQFYPQYLLELPNVWERRREGRVQEFDSSIDTNGYPSYYLQNFHYQTNGYLSDRSANLYDLQVEILFGGAADAMRRRVLAPLKAGLQAEFAAIAPRQLRVLDVACGTGRTLLGLRAAFPEVSLYGTDLSPAYLRKASQTLGELPGELPQLLQANAEQLPYIDEHFHAVTCVFAFHELPAPARQNVIDEIARVLQPGGTFVICDSIQADDAPELEAMMVNFSAVFHEPYYRHYMSDDLDARLSAAGLELVRTESHFASKYWIARKPVTA